MKKNGIVKKIIIKTTTFCWKHKFIVGLGASMLGAYCYGRHVQNDIYRKQEDAIQKERERQDKIAEWERKQKEYEENPENHLGDCGLIVDDWWDEGIDTCPVGNMIISGAKLEDIGDLGEEIIERIEDGKCGSMDPETLRSLVHGNHKVDLVLSVSPVNEPKEEKEEDSGTRTIVNRVKIEDVPKDIALDIADELHERVANAVRDICDEHGYNALPESELKDESTEKEPQEEVKAE